MLFFQSCWLTRDHIGRPTGISNPAWYLPQVVPRVVQTTGSVHPQPILPNCQLCINTEPTTSIGRLIKSLYWLYHLYPFFFSFFFQAEDGIRDFCLSRGLGDVYKRQHIGRPTGISNPAWHLPQVVPRVVQTTQVAYTPSLHFPIANSASTQSQQPVSRTRLIKSRRL